MRKSTTENSGQMNLVIFDLPAVINYKRLPLRDCLRTAVLAVTGVLPDEKAIDWRSGNCSGIITRIFSGQLKREPLQEEMDHIKASFLRDLKSYFLHTENPFDVWPGVQNIFQSINRKLDWECFIISDYWDEATRFILDSCGIYTKGLKVYSADNASSSEEVIHKIIKEYSLDDRERLYILSDHIDVSLFQALNSKIKSMRPPKGHPANALEYPRFSKLFLPVN